MEDLLDTELQSLQKSNQTLSAQNNKLTTDFKKVQVTYKLNFSGLKTSHCFGRSTNLSLLFTFFRANLPLQIFFKD